MIVRMVHRDIREYELEPLGGYTVEQVLDLLNTHQAWTSPSCGFYPGCDEIIQTLVGDDTVLVGKMKNGLVDHGTEWVK
jgi:hypothetical protein